MKRSGKVELPINRFMYCLAFLPAKFATLPTTSASSSERNARMRLRVSLEIVREPVLSANLSKVTYLRRAFVVMAV